MGVFNPNDFLNALMTYMAANAAGGALSISGTPRAFWARSAIEASAADPYHVLSPFGGEIPWVPAARVSLQVLTVGKRSSDALAASSNVLASLLDGQGRPRRMIDLANNYRLLGATALQPPRIVEIEENDRTRVAFNFDARAANVG